MSSEIEVVDEVESRDPAINGGGAAGGGFSGEPSGIGAADESLRNDVYTAAAYGDMEKLQRLVEFEGCSVSEPDGLGYYALQWAALNNRTAAAQYIIEVFIPLFMTFFNFGLLLFWDVGLVCFAIGLIGYWELWGNLRAEEVWSFVFHNDV